MFVIFNMQLPSKRRSVDEEEHFGDNDRPRSPSPQARVSDGVIRDIPLNTSHGAHSTFDISFGTENGKNRPCFSEGPKWIIRKLC